MQTRLKTLAHSESLHALIFTLIVLNALCLGVEVTPGLDDQFEDLLGWVFGISQVSMLTLAVLLVYIFTVAGVHLLGEQAPAAFGSLFAAAASVGAMALLVDAGGVFAHVSASPVRYVYTYRDRAYLLGVSAGKVEGHDQPVSLADYAVGNRVPVVLDPDQPDESYRDTFFDVWGTPLVAFMAQIAALFGGLAARRQNT